VLNKTENIVGCPVCQFEISVCISRVEEWLKETDSPKYFICANPHSLVTAQTDPAFHKAIQEADLVTPDGSGIVLASRILGGRITERITGSDIFYGLSKRLNQSPGSSYFFLGSTGETLADIKEKLAKDYPNIHFAGSYSPPYTPEFSDEENRLMIDAINAVKPDVLWVGMTAPKQEKWIHQHRDQLDVKFIGAIGAVFDFYTGKVKRSHPVFQKMGLEWFPRLLREPRRLFRRNFISSPKFLLMVLGQRFGSIRKNGP